MEASPENPETPIFGCIGVCRALDARVGGMDAWVEAGLHGFWGYWLRVSERWKSGGQECPPHTDLFLQAYSSKLIPPGLFLGLFGALGWLNVGLV